VKNGLRQIALKMIFWATEIIGTMFQRGLSFTHVILTQADEIPRLNGTRLAFIGLLKYPYSLSKLSTMMAPIDAGIEIMINRLSATRVSLSSGNLFNEKSTSATMIAVIA